MSAATETSNYATCLTCGIDLATPDDAQAHRSETFAADKAARSDGYATSHSTRVVNPTAAERVLAALLPPGLADQIQRAATECATAPDGDVLYAACWCDDGAHAEADSTAWRTTRERAERDQLQALGPEPHLIRQTQITEVIA